MTIGRGIGMAESSVTWAPGVRREAPPGCPGREVPPGCFIGGCDDEGYGRVFERAEDGGLFRICDVHYEVIMQRLEEMGREGLFDE
jgi:hypothetical protein